MCLMTALYGDGTASKVFEHRMMHFDVDMDSLVTFFKTDKSNTAKLDSDCQISAR